MWGLFSSAKTKTALRLVNGRIHLLTQKKQQHLAAAGKDIATLLASGKYDSARIKVEGLLREERLVAAYEILDLFLELITQRMAVLERAKAVPDEMREAVTTVLYMSARASLELPELEAIRGQLATKFGKELVLAACSEASAASAGVNDRILALMSVAPPPGDIKLRRLKELAEQHGVPFDADKVGTSILGVAHDMVATPGQAAAWTEPAPTEAELQPGTANAPAPILDGYSVPRVTSPPVVPLPSPAAQHSPEEEEEYPNAAAAARAAAKSAEKAASAAAAAARLASPQEGLPRMPEAASEPPEETHAACDDDLPSTPSDAPTPPPPAAEDDLDALTRRFEELKRRM